jgi:hypothetical protein
VLRGGSWINNGRNVRSANRNRNEPSERNHNNGLRLARAHGFAGRQMSDQTIIPSALYIKGAAKSKGSPACE